MVGDPLLALGYFVGTLAPAVLECHGNFRGFAFFFFSVVITFSNLLSSLERERSGIQVLSAYLLIIQFQFLYDPLKK